MSKRNGTTERSVAPVTGSLRHVSKTHGSHNARLDSWPNISDAIERPQKLQDPVLHHVRFGRKHTRARMPKTVISKPLYQDPTVDFPRTPIWIVSVEANPVQSWLPKMAEVAVTARSADEACAIAIDIVASTTPGNTGAATARLRK